MIPSNKITNLLENGEISRKRHAGNIEDAQRTGRRLFNQQTQRYLANFKPVHHRYGMTVMGRGGSVDCPWQQGY